MNGNNENLTESNDGHNLNGKQCIKLSCSHLEVE